MQIPTIGQIARCYSIIAVSERAKAGRPGERTVRNALSGLKRICMAAGLPYESPVSRLTRRVIDVALAALMARGVARVTARSYVAQMQSIFARWTRGYYADAGWRIKPLEMPSFRAQEPRYQRPSPEQLAAVKSWYQSISCPARVSENPALWFAVTMMLEFAMRNGDVLRLGSENFIKKGGQRFLCYVPHKTELTSGRRVLWPVHASIWNLLEATGGVDAYDITDEVFAHINKAMRSMGFRGSKGAYELRKICIDHVYQNYGAEMATSISGDDIRTISRYYADPAQPNIGSVRIVDLI